MMLDEPSLNRLRELDPQGTGKLLGRVFASFENSLARLLPQIVDAGHGGKFEAVSLGVHTLKSSASYCGALEMARQCADIEALIRDKRFDGLDARIAELLRTADAVRAALRAVPEYRA